MMGVLQFLVIATILNIHLGVVQLKDLTGDHNISKSIFSNQAKRHKISLTEDPMRSKQILQPTFTLGKRANERYHLIADDLFLAQHSLSPPAEAVVTVPFDLNSFLDSNPRMAMPFASSGDAMPAAALALFKHWLQEWWKSCQTPEKAHYRQTG